MFREDSLPLKQVVIGWFLSQYIQEKKHDATNASYGGYKGLTKNGAYEELGIEAVDATTFAFTFRQEFGGQMRLMDVLPGTPGADGRKSFDLVVGRIPNDEMDDLETNHEWYRRSPWSAFDPAKVDASRLETLTLVGWPEPRSTDAWIDYARLFADGKVGISVHFGWDYHNSYHLVHSKAVYDWLVGEQGFASPVASYDDLTHVSGPLAREIDANGRKVVVEVSLFWGKPGTDTDPDTDAGGRALEDVVLERVHRERGQGLPRRDLRDPRRPPPAEDLARGPRRPRRQLVLVRDHVRRARARRQPAPPPVRERVVALRAVRRGRGLRRRVQPLHRARGRAGSGSGTGVTPGCGSSPPRPGRSGTRPSPPGSRRSRPRSSRRSHAW
ncbi:MAG: hypothetical protein FJ087_11075 [Deltaproteobacteria bacterium]|nr:hypothetical protein [Deltaproteobacteria bacterium]